MVALLQRGHWMPIFPKVIGFFRVFLKWSQWLCKTTPFLSCQKQLCSQWLVSVHISLHANAPHLSLLWKWSSLRFNFLTKPALNCPSFRKQSILGRGSFCFNYCLLSAWHGGDQFVALLRWYGSPGFFDSGLQLICIFWSLISYLYLLTIIHRFSMGFRSGEFAGHLTNFWCFWQCGQVPNPAGKWNQHL